MKKVLSVAMASAMVLGMGANAFAIQYSTGSSDTAAWPSGFQFDGSLFVTDEDGDIVTSTITDLNGKTRVDFMPGDTIWMPLYANNQKVYTVDGYQKGYDKVAATTVSLKPVLNITTDEDLVTIDANGKVQPFYYEDAVNKVVYYYGYATAPSVKEGWRTAEIKTVKVYVGNTESTDVVENKLVESTQDGYLPVQVVNAGGTISFNVGNGWATPLSVGGSVTGPNMFKRTSNIGTADYFNNTAVEAYRTVTYNDVLAAVGSTAVNGATIAVPFSDVVTNVNPQPVLKSNVTVVASLPEVPAVKEDLGTTKPVDQESSSQNFVNTVAYGHYTGNIDKNWSINLIEEDNGVADLVEKAELYKADEVDYLSYKDHTTEIMPNAVYLKVTLKDSWKLADDADLKYYVYVADNKSGNETNKVWVSGTYAASYQYVDFTWTNDASKAGLWKVKDGENGVAVFDFADKAFFQVKMYSKESMYLDLSTAYDKAIAGDFSEADAFFAFDNENANFSRTGTLILVSDDASLIPYQVTEDGYTKVDAEYVEDFAIAHTNEKVDGFVFETKELGNYVLSTEEVEVEEDDKDDNTQEVVVPDDDNKETNNNSKPNPSTGAEDFVGLAVSLAVVSVAAAGALALKK